MSKTLLAFGLLLAAGPDATQSALAQDQTLAPIVVERANGERLIVDCAPPNSEPGCARLHALIRMNFTPREIGMLFGASTGYLEYPTAYERVRTRYVAFLDDIEMNGLPVEASYRY